MGKIQFWKGKENVSKSVDSKIYNSGNSVTALIPKREKKSETLVNELLKQTLVEHLSGQKSADDTILVFDEIFAKIKPDQIVDEIIADDEIVGNVANVANSDSVEIPNDTEKLDESNPDLNLSNFGTPTEKVDGKYRCSSCSKDFKF